MLRPVDLTIESIAHPESGPVLAQPAGRLIEWAVDFVFFTPAPFAVHARWGRDPVGEYCRMRPAPPAERPRVVRSDRPFFSGLGQSVLLGETVDWDRRLYLLPRERWPECREVLGGFATFDPRSGYYCRAGLQTVVVPDPTWPGESTAGPQLEVTAFPALRADGIYLLAASADGEPGLRHTRCEPPELLRQQAAAIVRGDLRRAADVVLPTPEPPSSDLATTSDP